MVPVQAPLDADSSLKHRHPLSPETFCLSLERTPGDSHTP